jgi:hypothetical protein
MKETIHCQSCDETREDKGCSSCWGYGIIAQKAFCKCGRPYWERPGTRTMYAGMRYRSLDGLTFIVGEKFEVRCVHCVA